MTTTAEDSTSKLGYRQQAILSVATKAPARTALYVVAKRAGCAKRYNYLRAAVRLEELGLVKRHETGGGVSHTAEWIEVLPTATTENV